MLLVVTGIGTLVHIYSLVYMEDDDAKPRFFGGPSLFMFSMLGIVLANNFVMMFIFWELVGVVSYLLIGHWFTRDTAAGGGEQGLHLPTASATSVSCSASSWSGAPPARSVFRGIAGKPANAQPNRRLTSPLAALLHLLRRRRQDRAVPAARLAARRHGRPDAGLRADPRGDHGRRRRLHAGARFRSLSAASATALSVSLRGSASSPRCSPR